MSFINSNTITFMDTADTKKIDVHIISNHPTVQIYDTNKGEYIPNWESDSLILTPIVYADSLDITDQITEFKWEEIKNNTTLDLGATKELNVSSNELENIEFVRYKFSGKYNNKPFENEIVFTRVNTGKDGSDGDSAPAVQAQYSEDGLTSWSSTFDTSKHKYIHFSYDGGISWSRPPIKIAGEDGTSVTIQGVAYTNDTLVAGNIVDLYSNETVHNDSTKILGTETGDSYLVGGYLCVYNAANKQFVCTGRIQGPKGDQGDSYYLFIRYADDINGTNMSATAGNRKYIGFYRSSTNVAPTNISYDTWGWTKFVGNDAKSITLSANTQVFKVDKNNIVSPATLEITAQAVNTSVTEWLYSTNGGQSFSTTLPAGAALSGNKIIIDGAATKSNSITVKAWDGVYGDTLTIYKVFDGVTGDKGADAPIAFLTNEHIGFTANANGQISGTTVYCNVVAYNGTEKVVPTIGDTIILPAGMTIGDITTELNELKLPIIIEDNATLGGNHGTIEIPVSTPVNTKLKLSWSKVNAGPKGETGVGIKSTTVWYGVSDSASTQPADNAWQSTVPTVADGKYLWTRTIIDYTDNTIPDTVTYTYAKQGVKGDTGSAGSSVTVSKIEYQEGASATLAPTSNWSNSVVSVAEGKYLWSKTTFSDGKIAYGVAKQGTSGRGISKITEYYLATTASSGITTDADGWTTTIQSIDATKKYLWNYEIVTYTDGSTSPTAPVIIGVFGNTGATGKGIKSVTEYYLATNLSSGVKTSDTGWTSTMQTLTSTKKYLWNYELITYTDNSTSTINPVIIGVYGDKGDDGVGINSTTVDYGVSDSATVKPTTWQQDIPVVAEGKYLWTRTITDYTDTSKTDTVTYVYAKQGSKGDTGTAGTSVTVKSIKYQAGTSATTAPTGTWSDSVVAVAEGSYLWTQTTFSDNKVAYGVAKQGQKGDKGDKGDQGVQGPKGNDGQQYYTWVKYADTPTSGMSNDPDGKTYIGLAYNKTTATESTTYSDYAWSLIRGATGAVGPKGADGKQYYTWIKYADNASGANMSDLPDGKLYIGLAYNKTTSTESNVASDYTWALFKGDKGDKGIDGITFQVYSENGYVLSNELESLTLQTFAYDGNTEITSSATYQWSQYIDDVWTNISGATTKTLAITKGDVLKAKSYKCTMTYKSKQYVATVTVQDKTDIYNSIMCISSNARGNDCYWVLYTLVYTDAEEIDPLLGPISINAPTSPVSGDYWYAVDASNASVQLKKYNGTSWVNSTDTQSLSYYWDIVNDGSIKVPFGNASKVQVISCHDFTSTATLVCEVNNAEDGLLTQSSLSLTDASDPIVSTTEPTGMVDGQIWIKPNDNGTYFMSVWDATNDIWITSDMDSRTKVHTSRPSSYSVGDLWVTASDADHSDYLAGTLLQANTTSTTYNANHWSATLKYDKDLDKIKETLNDLSEYVNITSEGLKIGAMSASGEISPFTSLFTSTELAFYQNSEKLLTLTNSQLIAPHVVVEDELEVQGSINLGNLKLTIEDNGSFSFAVTK